MVVDDTSSAVVSINDNTPHICELHPLLVLESIPGSGMGYRIGSGDEDGIIIKKGELLLTESSICSGPLTADSSDKSMVSQFTKQVHTTQNGSIIGGYYQGNLSMALLTVPKYNESDNIPKPFSDAWVQDVLDNNVYQCRREPNSSALFCALARFNHSCTPNAINDACSKLARVRAVRNILQGEEVTISYVPLSHNLQRRTEALGSFGFTCQCNRCIRERMFDPSMQCDDCDNIDAEKRHEAVVATNIILQDAVSNDVDDSSGIELDPLRELAAETLLLAPFATHPETIRLHRTLIQLLQKMDHGNDDAVIMEKLREIQRLDLAHGGAKHRDLYFLRICAMLVIDCRKSFTKKKEYIEARWVDLCLLHFGERTAPDKFMATVNLAEVVIQHIPIGCDGDRLALFDGDNEIDLSGHEILDSGCEILCTAIAQVSPLIMLDLDSNGLTSDGGIALGHAFAAGYAPILEHLDLMCNKIGSVGACALAASLDSCPLLTYLDLHGNDIGDDGCVALRDAFSRGFGRRLVHLNLGANGIEEGCNALSILFRGDNSSGGRVLTHLDLSKNAIECPSFLCCSVSQNSNATVHLDLSFNCITDFTCLTRTRCWNALAVLKIEGNVLSDRECNQFYKILKDTGITPMLECEEEDNNGSVTEFIYDEDNNDELHLRHCLKSLADGETTNYRVCRDTIWGNYSDDTTTETCNTNDMSVQDSDRSHLQNLLERDGYFVVPQLFLQWGDNAASGYTMSTIASTMNRLDLAGWPPLFCFMCDSVWNLVSNLLWDEMRILLGDDCVLEPSVFAWSLKPNKAGEEAVLSNSNGKIGQSFGLPHRDYPASESMFEDGKTPKLLNVWIPINDVTLDNGCMNILPKEFDPLFCQPDHPEHMRPATVIRGNICKLRLALHGAKAIPAKAGSLLAWCGNTIHWGSSCSQHSTAPPRKSIAMTFRRRDVAQLDESDPITQENALNMSMDMRLALISRSLLLYNQWHKLNGAAVPPALYDVTNI